MNRLTEILVYLGLSGYFTAAHAVRFDPGLMPWIALGGVLIVGGVLLVRVRKGQASPVDWFMTSYLLLCLAGFLLWPGGLGRLLAAYPVPLLYVVFLFGVALPPLFGGDLFTMFWARQWTAKAVWETDIFRTINLRMTLVWAGLFLISGLVALFPILIPALDTTLWRLVIGLGGPALVLAGIGVPFNGWYPGRYLRSLGLDPSFAGGGPEQGSEAPAAPERPKVSDYSSSDQTLTTASTPSKEQRMSDKPLVVAVNGSPRPEISNTGQLIEMFREPLEEQGFELEVINLGNKKINYCLGDAYCLDKGQCWQRDDQKEILNRILESQAVILGCPVYIMNVTATMKTFLDRSLALGHKPRDSWKPGLSVCVSAGLAETEVAQYLSNCLRIFGAFSLGSLTAMGSGGAGEFFGKEHVQARARDLALDLARAVREKRRIPATDQDLRFYQFMGDLVKRSKEFMRHDYEHWEKLGLFDSFENYIKQDPNKNQMNDPALRKAWLKELMAKHKGEQEMSPDKDAPQGAADAASCQDLIKMMPLGFQPEAAKDLKAVIQFDITGDEEFTAHLEIADGKATHKEGPAEKPDLTVKAPAKVWLGISQGKINGQMAFMTGKFKAQGDFGLLLKLNNLFKG